MAAQCDAGGSFRKTLAVCRRCVEIVHAMAQGIVNHCVHHFLVNLFVAFSGASAPDTRQPHHAEAEN